MSVESLKIEKRAANFRNDRWYITWKLDGAPLANIETGNYSKKQN